MSTGKEYDFHKGSEAVINPRNDTNMWCTECDGASDHDELTPKIAEKVTITIKIRLFCVRAHLVTCAIKTPVSIIFA